MKTYQTEKQLAESTVPLREVFQDELEFIQKRREFLFKCREQGFGSDSQAKVPLPKDKKTAPVAFKWANDIEIAQGSSVELEAKSGDSQTDNFVDGFDSLREVAFDADLCGLAISGGGVRAATFGLGVLQGLAKEKMLSRFDYLSTVSGGGYIGGFLSAWIREEGIEKVESSLAAGARETTKNSYCRGGNQESIEPIKHLRKYGNHLTPVPGIFSYDGWSLLAIYARNLFLNQLTIFLLGLLVFGVLRTIVMLFSFAESPALASPFAMAFVLAFLIGFSILCCFQLKSFFEKTGPREGRKRTGEHTANWLGQNRDKMLIGMFHCLAATQCLAVTSSIISQIAVAVFLSITFFFLSFVNSATVEHQPFKVSNLFRGSFPLVLRRFLPGLVAGALLAFVVSFFDKTWEVVTFGVPIAMFFNLLAVWLMVGWLEETFNEADREWWGTVSSRMLIAAAIWAALFCFAVFSPVVFSWGYEKLFLNEWTFASVAGPISSILAVLGGTTTGLYAANSLSVGKKQNSIMRLLAQAAPYLFLFVVFFAICMVWTAAIYFCYAQFQMDNGIPGFWDTVTDGKFHFLHHLSLSHRLQFGGFEVPAIIPLALVTVVLWFFAFRISARVGINRFSLQNMYSTRLSRCYLGARRVRNSADLTNFDFEDDFLLKDLFKQEPGNFAHHVPLQIINCAVNKGSAKTEDQLATQDRKSDSFFMTPQHCGSDATGFVSTEKFGPDVSAGLAMGISGAAVSSSMGFRTTPGMSVLLTLFNLRLGWWFPKPGISSSLDTEKSLDLLIQEMAGAGIQDNMINVSDGGHFENMGVYELIRRNCRFIVCIDADSRPDIHENIGRVVRMARIDFNALIDIDADDLTPVDGMCNAHFVVGRIHYDNDRDPSNPNFKEDKKQGVIVWISLAMTGDEPEDLQQYQVATNQFPYAPTFPDQFFSEDQFESYRELGVHSVANLFSGIRVVEEGENSSQNQDGGKRVWRGVRRKRIKLGAPRKTKDPVDSELPELVCEITYQPIKTATSKDELSQVDLRTKVNHRNLFSQLHQRWLPLPPQVLTGYVEQNNEYMKVLSALRNEPALARLANELYGTSEEETTNNAKVPETAYNNAERLMTAQMMALLENVWFALDLQTYLTHPVNEGWKQVFEHWTNNAIIREHWNERIHEEFSPVFRGFVKSIQNAE